MNSLFPSSTILTAVTAAPCSCHQFSVVSVLMCLTTDEMLYLCFFKHFCFSTIQRVEHIIIPSGIRVNYLVLMQENLDPNFFQLKKSGVCLLLF